MFLVTSELTKACGRAVIIIHYSIILPQHILYNLNISWTNHRQDADMYLGNWTEQAQCQIMTIMAKTGGLQIACGWVTRNTFPNNTGLTSRSRDLLTFVRTTTTMTTNDRTDYFTPCTCMWVIMTVFLIHLYNIINMCSPTYGDYDFKYCWLCV